MVDISGSLSRQSLVFSHIIWKHSSFAEHLRVTFELTHQNHVARYEPAKTFGQRLPAILLVIHGDII